MAVRPPMAEPPPAPTDLAFPIFGSILGGFLGIIGGIVGATWRIRTRRREEAR